MDAQIRAKLIHNYELGEVYATQRQDAGEGWDTILVFAGNEEGRKAAIQLRDRLLFLDHKSREHRAVSMIVWPDQATSENTGFGDPDEFDAFNIHVLD